VTLFTRKRPLPVNSFVFQPALLTLCRQALELVESAVGSDHVRVAQELTALSRVVRKSGRQVMADNLQQRTVNIMKKNGSPGSVRIQLSRVAYLLSVRFTTWMAGPVYQGSLVRNGWFAE